MQHTAIRVRSGDSENSQGELPALLVPGGSCSSLCRPHTRDDAALQPDVASLSNRTACPQEEASTSTTQLSTSTALLRPAAGSAGGH